MNIQIKDLSAVVKDKKVLDKLNLDIKNGEIHAIMGPNGAGKSTLSKVIMDSFDYKVTNGDIICNDESIMKLTTSERASLGIFLSFQDPIEIEGVTNSEFLRESVKEKNKGSFDLYNFITEFNQNFKDLELNKDLMHRSLNQNFSGGEKKKNEILQMKMLKPRFIILDELDSGLDVDSLNVVCKNINDYLKENKNTSVLIITHYPRILEFIKPNYVHILMNGKIVKSGDYSLAKEIEEKGYKEIISSTSLISEK